MFSYCSTSYIHLVNQYRQVLYAKMCLENLTGNGSQISCLHGYRVFEAFLEVEAELGSRQELKSSTTGRNQRTNGPVNAHLTIGQV